MCKLCDLEFQKRVRQFLGRTDIGYKDYPEDIKEYMNWCNKELSVYEGIYLDVNKYGKEEITMVVISEDPFCAGIATIKFCPHCGRKLDAEEYNE